MTDYYTIAASCCTHRKSVCVSCVNILGYWLTSRDTDKIQEKICLMQCASYIHDIFGFRST